MAALDQVQSPTLLIVGGLDDVVIELNGQAYRQLKAEKRLTIVPGATHLFEEPGTLEQVAQLAAEWFNQHLGHESEKRTRARKNSPTKSLPVKFDAR